MRAEPQDFQVATPIGFAEPTAYAEAELDPSQINVFPGDHVEAGSASSARGGKSVRDFVRLGDIGWLGNHTSLGATGLDVGSLDVRSLGVRSLGVRSLGDIVGGLRLPDAVRLSLIAGGLIVAFGLGWTCASIFNSNSEARLAASDASLALPAQRPEVSRGQVDAEKQSLRHHDRVAGNSAARRPPLGEPNRPKPPVAIASAHSAVSSVAQIESVLQRVPPQSMPERIGASASVATSSDTDRPLVAVPDTKPTTIPGWTVREVDGETAVLIGPDHVWTVRAGDNVPGVGRVDSIVRWGNRWIVATTAGLISTP